MLQDTIIDTNLSDELPLYFVYQSAVGFFISTNLTKYDFVWNLQQYCRCLFNGCRANEILQNRSKFYPSKKSLSRLCEH